MRLKHLTLGCLFLIPFGCVASDNAPPKGFLEGHLHVSFLGAAEAPDQIPRPPGPETYAEYPLVILSLEGKKEIARITADEQGNYRTALPPGAYILDVQNRTKRVRARPQEFTVVANQPVRVDMSIIIGFR